MLSYYNCTPVVYESRQQKILELTVLIYTVIQVDITTILQSISKIEQKTWPPKGGKTKKTRSFATKLQGRSKTEKSQ